MKSAVLIDLRKDPTYKATAVPQIVEVPEMLFVTAEGQGAPESPGGETEFQQAMQAIFGVAYTIKFWDKKHAAPPGYAAFTLAPVEGLWWTAEGELFDAARPNEWRWRVMLRLPEFVTPPFFAEVVADLTDKKQSDVYRRARLAHFKEGTCVQILHVGPYDQEKPSLDSLHEFAAQQGYEVYGHHHELYFSDPRRTAPEKLRTILRYPVRKI